MTTGTGTARRSRSTAALAGPLLAVSATLLVLGLAVALRYDQAVAWLQWAPTAVAFAFVGWVVARRQARNTIGWLLLLFGAQFALLIAALVVARAVEARLSVGAPVGPAELTLARWAAWWHVVNVDLLVLPLTLLLMLFPTGRLVSRAWRPALAAVCLVSGLVMAMLVLTDVNFAANYDHLSDPVTALPGSPLRTLYETLQLLELLGLAVAAVSLVVRYRSSDATQRLQIKWVTAAAALMVGLMLAMLLTPMVWLVPDPTVGAAVGMPVLALSIGVAVLRYRLFEIDRLVSRTVSYAAVTGTVLVTYVASVTLLSRLVPSRSSLPVAAATLLAAAVFRPVLTRVRAVVDRRFDRTRYDQLRTVGQFGERLRQQVRAGEVTDALLATVRVTLQPASAGLWLREQR